MFHNNKLVKLPPKREKGEILKIGKFTLEEIKNKINWESSEE